MQTLHALNTDAACALALDVRAHPDQHFSQVGNLGLLRGVFKNRLALGQGCRHQEVLSTCDSDHVSGDAAALQASAFAIWPRWQFGNHVAMFHHNICTHGLQTLDVLLNRPRTNGTTAWQRHRGFAKARQQRAEGQHRSTHGLDQFVRCFRRTQVSSIDGDCARTDLAALCTDTHVAHQREHGHHVLQLRHIFQCDRLRREQRRTQLWQCSVLGTRDDDSACQRPAALDK